MLSCCIRSARRPSQGDEAYDEVEKSRRTIKRQRRPIMEVSSRQPWNPFAGAVSRYKVHVALMEALVYEFGRRRWFGFGLGQARRLLIGKAKGGKRRAGDGAVTAAVAVDGREGESTNVHFHPLVKEERASSPAPAVEEKTLFPLGGYNRQCKPPAHITFEDRCGPGSLEAFLEFLIAASMGGGGGSTPHGVPGNRWVEIAEAKARRQRYLRDYCPFQREEEISAPAAPEETTEAAEVDHAVVKQLANCPGSEGGDDTTTGVRDMQARAVRGTAEYYVMRQEFLKRYHIRTFREKAPRLPAADEVV